MNRIKNFLLAAASVAVLAAIMVPMNTGRVAGAPPSPSTVVVSDQTITHPDPNPGVHGVVINVSAYKQIRVVVSADEIECSTTFLENTDSGGSTVLGWLDNGAVSSCWLDRSYDTPGVYIRALVKGGSGAGNKVRVVVYGQPY